MKKCFLVCLLFFCLSGILSYGFEQSELTFSEFTYDDDAKVLTIGLSDGKDKNLLFLSELNSPSRL